MDGEAGYCLVQTMHPTSACARTSEAVGFFGLAAALGAIYFAIGAVIAMIRQKKITTLCILTKNVFSLPLS